MQKDSQSVNCILDHIGDMRTYGVMIVKSEGSAKEYVLLSLLLVTITTVFNIKDVVLWSERSAKKNSSKATDDFGPTITLSLQPISTLEIPFKVAMKLLIS